MHLKLDNMKKLFTVCILMQIIIFNSLGANGDSIFNPWTIHTLRITYPYPTFYDSLLRTNSTDQYLMVQVDFNSEHYDSIGIQAKGNSSFSGPGQKKSFKLDINEFVRGQDIHGLKKLNFNNSFKDPTMMREKIVNDFLLAHNLPAPRTTYCNVYMNGQLWGLYTIVEAIDDEFCKRWFDNDDGNLFQGDPRGDLMWKGSSTQSLYTPSYDLENNTTLNDWSDLISLIDVINNTPTANLHTVLDNQLNVNTFLKQWACINLFASLDSYFGSGHNYYIYHDTIADKFQWIGWDNNEAFGNFKNGLSSTQIENLDMYYISNPTSNRPLCNNILLNPTYKEAYNQAYCELLGDFSNALIDPKIDSLNALIRASVFADPKKTTTNAQYDSNIVSKVTMSGPGGLDAFGLKSFIGVRRAAALASLSSHSVTCTNALNDATAAGEHPIVVAPNPATDNIQIFSEMPVEGAIRIFDINGKLVLEEDARMRLQIDIDISNWSKGCYILKINNGEKVTIQKVIKE